MSLPRIAAPLLAASLCGLAAFGSETDAEPEIRSPDLAAGHLAQAKAIASPAATQGADAEIERLKAEIETKLLAWEKLVSQAPAEADLLSALPKELLAEAAKSGADAAQAAASLKKHVTLAWLLALAAVRNPEVKAAHERWRASLSRFSQASYLEDLVSQFRSFVRELDTKVGPQSHKEMPGKTFPFPSSLALKGQLVDLDAKAAHLQYEKTLRTALNSTARAFFEVQYVTKAAAIVKENRDLFAQMESNALEQLKVGRASQADTLKAQSMLAVLDNRLVTLQRQRENDVARVNAYLDLPPAAEWGEVTEADLDGGQPTLDDALKAAQSGSQEVRIAATMADSMALMVRLAETMVYPRGSAGMSQLAPSLGAEAGPTRKPEAAFPNRPMVTPRAATFGSNAAYIDELRVRVTQAKEDQAAVEARIAFRTKDAHFRADVANRDFKTYAESVVPKTQQAFKTMQERYNTASSPFIEYLDAGRSYLDASLQREQARKAHNTALTDLLDAQGRSAADHLPGK